LKTESAFFENLQLTIMDLEHTWGSMLAALEDSDSIVMIKKAWGDVSLSTCENLRVLAMIVAAVICVIILTVRITSYNRGWRTAFKAINLNPKKYIENEDDFMRRMELNSEHRMCKLSHAYNEMVNECRDMDKRIKIYRGEVKDNVIPMCTRCLLSYSMREGNWFILRCGHCVCHKCYEHRTKTNELCCLTCKIASDFIPWKPLVFHP
jgi:hypothetical protein